MFGGIRSLGAEGSLDRIDLAYYLYERPICSSPSSQAAMTGMGTCVRTINGGNAGVLITDPLAKMEIGIAPDSLDNGAVIKCFPTLQINQGQTLAKPKITLTCPGSSLEERDQSPRKFDSTKSYIKISIAEGGQVEEIDVPPIKFLRLLDIYCCSQLGPKSMLLYTSSEKNSFCHWDGQGKKANAREAHTIFQAAAPSDAVAKIIKCFSCLKAGPQGNEHWQRLKGIQLNSPSGGTNTYYCGCRVDGIEIQIPNIDLLGKIEVKGVAQSVVSDLARFFAEVSSGQQRKP